MKKILSFLMSILLFGSVMCSFVGCNKEESKQEEQKFDPNQNLDVENMFFDDFTNGISPDKWIINDWASPLPTTAPKNISYSEDGIVAIQCNGDLYTGENGKRTAAQITTRDYLGPGRYETRMKILPRFGSASVFYTYVWQDPLNHEIDIELNVEDDFTVVWNTNWHELTLSDHYIAKTPIVNNDGEWHVYKFEWHTNPERIDYYIDDVLTHTSFAFIPNMAGRLTIGNWFPEWAGSKDFETDYTLIDWFKFTPYLNNDYIPHEKDPASDLSYYPTSPKPTPIANLISNAKFESKLPIPINSWQNGKNAWRTNKKINLDLISFVDEGLDSSSAIKLQNNAVVYQYITGMHESFNLTMLANAKGKGQIKIDFMPAENKVLGSEIIDINSTNWEKQKLTFNLPKTTKRLKVQLFAAENETIYFDNLFCNLTKKVPTTI